MTPSNIPHWNILPFIRLLFLVLVFFFQYPGTSKAIPITREYTIKASLILKIIDFVKWPKSKNRPAGFSTYHLCILGKNNFGNLFAQAKEEGLLQKNVIIVQEVSDPEMKNCDILFLTGKNDSNLNKALKILKNEPTLIIGESEGYGELGVGINFVERKNTVKFEINRTALKRQNIEISSFLLNLAIIIDGDH